MSIFASSVFPFLAGFLGAGLVARFGPRLRFMDESSERSSHTGSIPKGGGIGILLAFLVTGFWAGLPFGGIAGGAAVSIVSLLGDRYDLPPRLRLAVHGFCALALLGAAGPGILPGMPLLWLPLVVYVVGTANIFNFMDGINGIAGMTSVVAFGFLAWFLSRQAGSSETHMILGLAMAFSSLAFLFFNVPVAKVFMGDVGSILIGFVFSGTVAVTAGGPADFLCMSGFLLLFYLDEINTMALRLKLKESLFRPHRRHIYQILANELGYAHWRVALAYAVVQALLCIALIWAHNRGVDAILVICTAFGTAFFVFAHRVRHKAAIQ